MSAVNFDHYYASFEHMRDAKATSTTIHYLAKDLPEAARAARRFYDGRQRIMPELFGNLLCVKIYGFNVREIDENDNYNSGLTMHLFEWKCDMGWTYEDRVGYIEAQLERIRRPSII